MTAVAPNVAPLMTRIWHATRRRLDNDFQARKPLARAVAAETGGSESSVTGLIRVSVAAGLAQQEIRRDPDSRYRAYIRWAIPTEKEPNR